MKMLTLISYSYIINIQNECKRGVCMARNKYPEITVEKILDVSQRLFLEKDMIKQQFKILLMN